MERKKVLFYGAGEHATMIYRDAKRKSAAYGEPTAFIDKDVYKQGHNLFGLPVISWEDAQKQYGEDFYIYVTGNEKAAPEILGFLAESGVPVDRIINYEPVEWRLGCGIAESFLSIEPIGDTMRYFNCNRNADNLSYENVQFKYFLTPEIAAQSEVVKRAIDHVQNTAQKISEGDIEKLHLACANMRNGYYYSNRKIRSVNFVGTAPCNFKCSYCLLNHNDYEKVTYRPYTVFLEIMQQLEQGGHLDQYATVKMSCGEFSICPEGHRLVELAGKHPITVFTNGYIFSPQVANAIENSGMVLCSLDAGTRDTFRTVKGVDGFARVSENLKEYAKRGAVCLKYILLEGINDSTADLEGFFRLADEIAVRVDLTRDFMDSTTRFSDHTLEFASRFIKHFRNNGKLNMNMSAFVRSGEGERLNKFLEEV